MKRFLDSQSPPLSPIPVRHLQEISPNALFWKFWMNKMPLKGAWRKMINLKKDLRKFISFRRIIKFGEQNPKKRNTETTTGIMSSDNDGHKKADLFCKAVKARIGTLSAPKMNHDMLKFVAENLATESAFKAILGNAGPQAINCGGADRPFFYTHRTSSLLQM